MKNALNMNECLERLSLRKAQPKEAEAEWREMRSYIIVEGADPVSLEDGVLTLIFNGHTRDRCSTHYRPGANRFNTDGCGAELTLPEGVNLVRVFHPRSIGEPPYRVTFKEVPAIIDGTGYAPYTPDSQEMLVEGELPKTPCLEWELYDVEKAE